MTGKVDGTIADIMTAAGAFGRTSGLFRSNWRVCTRHTGLDQFASCVLYTSVDDHNDRRHGHRLMFKFKHPTLELRGFYNNGSQFHSEKLFYERIAPFLLASCGSQRNGDGTGTPTLCHYFYGRGQW